MATSNTSSQSDNLKIGQSENPRSGIDSSLPRRAFKVYAGAFITYLLCAGALIFFGAMFFIERDLSLFFSFLGLSLVVLFVLAVLLGLVAAYRIIRVFDEVFAEKYRALNELSTLTDNIAHDLRTPLTHLLSAAEVASPGELPAIVAEETSSMLSMINTMLEISQTGFKIERSPRSDVDVCAVARTIAEYFKMVAEDKSIAFALNLPPSPVVFKGHEAKIRELTANLVDNALKFTPAGGEVTLGVARREGGFAITVSDTGPGISPEDAPHVFERFWRSDKSRTLPGNGLGLALVKAIATSYAGKVSFAPAPGGGTVFTVEIAASG